MVKCTVFIPVYNEEKILYKNILVLIDFLNKQIEDFEIIIVSNGSTDRTAEVGNELTSKYEQVRFLQISKQGNIGEAFRLACQKASSPFIINCDADLTIEIEFIPEAIRLLEKHDIVIGAKILGFQHRPWIRKIGSSFYIFLADKLLGLNFLDFSPAAKAYRISSITPFLESLNKGTFFSTALLYLSQQANLSITSIPIRCDDYRRSKFNLIHLALEMFIGLFSLYFARLYSKKIRTP